MPTMAHWDGLRLYSKGFTTCLIRLESFLHTSVSLSPVDKRNQTNNPRKRNSPLNTRAEDIRVEVSFKPFEELIFYLLRVNRIFFLYSLFIPNKTLHVMHTRHASFWWSIIADIDPGQSSEWRRAGTGRLVRILDNRKMAGSELESSGEKLKAEIAEQTRDIMREMFAEFKKEEKQEK